MIFSAAGGWFGKSYAENYAEAAKYGFKACEMLGWGGEDLEAAKKVLIEKGITSTCLLVQSKVLEYALKLEWSHGIVYEDTEEAFVEAFKESCETAKFLGAPNIVVTTGNERTDVSRASQHAQIVKALKAVAPIAEAYGVTAVLEPLNILVNHKGYYLSTSQEGFEIIREVDSPNVRLLFDIYHQQITEGNLINNIKNNIDLIGHFHIGDNPGRNEPGTGEINYINVFKAIKETGYKKYLAFECGRTVDVETLMKNLKPYLDIAND